MLPAFRTTPARLKLLLLERRSTSALSRLAFAFLTTLIALGTAVSLPAAEPAPTPVVSPALRVGAAAAELEADDTMVIAGGIEPGKASGQEGKLRATAVVLAQGPRRLALVSLDILMMRREHLDPVLARIERELGIPARDILVNCTHTHHAPSTMVVHGYGLDETFVRRVQEGIFTSVRDAAARLAESRFFFHLGREATVGENSRVLLDDGQIYWIGPRTNFVRPTGPFDAELPVLAFRDADSDKLRAVLFNHSTHTIGTRRPGVRSPSIYGLAAQDLETDTGAIVSFLEGASGSTHNLSLTGDEAARRIRGSVSNALTRLEPRPVTRLDSIKRPLKFRVRHFDEAAEDAAVERYCHKYAPSHAKPIIAVFRNMRSRLASQQGEERETWVQALRIGDVAIVGVPAEYFTQLGIDIKNRSPFRHTYVAELANDWIGYLPNREGHKLGGYQVWTGFHSYAEPGTGERIADLAVDLLHELAR